MFVFRGSALSVWLSVFSSSILYAVGEQHGSKKTFSHDRATHLSTQLVDARVQASRLQTLRGKQSEKVSARTHGKNSARGERTAAQVGRKDTRSVAAAHLQNRAKFKSATHLAVQERRGDDKVKDDKTDEKKEDTEEKKDDNTDVDEKEGPDPLLTADGKARIRPKGASVLDSAWQTPGAPTNDDAVWLEGFAEQVSTTENHAAKTFYKMLHQNTDNPDYVMLQVREAVVQRFFFNQMTMGSTYPLHEEAAAQDKKDFNAGKLDFPIEPDTYIAWIPKDLTDIFRYFFGRMLRGGVFFVEKNLDEQHGWRSGRLEILDVALEYRADNSEEQCWGQWPSLTTTTLFFGIVCVMRHWRITHTQSSCQEISHIIPQVH